MDQRQEPWQALDLTGAGFCKDALGPHQPAKQATANAFLGGQQQDQNDQDRCEDHDQVENVLTLHMHLFGQFTDRLNLLFARLKHHRQEQAEEISHRRQRRSDDHLVVGHAGQCGQNEGRDPHHRWHD